MSAYISKLTHRDAIIKVTANTTGAGASFVIGLGTTGYSNQFISANGTIGIALFETGNAEIVGIGNTVPRVGIRKVKWSSQSGTTNGIRITRNSSDVLQLFYSGEFETTNLTENATSDIGILIDGSGTLIIELSKLGGYYYQNELELQQNTIRNP